MGRKRGKPDKRTGVVEVALAAGTALGAVQSTRERLNRFLLPFAWVIGAVGLMALAACGALAAVPEDHWPEALDPDLLPIYSTVSLAAASMLGWGCMQRGMGRMRARIGWRVGGWVFVLLPVLCGALVLADGRLAELAEWPRGRELALFARYYPPALIVLALVVFFLAELRGGDAREREQRGPGWQRAGWSLLLIGPYVLLMLTLVLGSEAPWLSEPLQDTLEELGAGAIVLQVAIAYFVSAGAASA